MSARDDVSMQLEALQSLYHAPGWAILKDSLQRLADAHMAKMQAATNPDDLLTYTHKFLAVSDLAKLPEALMRQCQLQLQLTKKP